jgi:hypothetical protein
MADSVGSKHILTALSSINSGSLTIPSGDPKFFRRPSGGFRPPIIPYFLPFVKQQQQLFKKFFVKTFFRFLKNIFIVPHFWGFVKKKMQQQQKIFSFLFFLILPDFLGFVKCFFQKQEKIFCQVFFQKKKKKKKNSSPYIIPYFGRSLKHFF